MAVFYFFSEMADEDMNKRLMISVWHRDPQSGYEFFFPHTALLYLYPIALRMAKTLYGVLAILSAIGLILGFLKHLIFHLSQN